MSSIKVLLYTSKVLKNGEHPIMLRVIKDRKPKYISIGASCAPEQWDEKKDLPKKKHPLYHELSVLIDSKKIEAKKLVIGLVNEQTEHSAEEVITVLRGSTVEKQQVLQYFDTVIEALKKQDRIGTAEIFKSTKNSLSTFRNGKDFDFSMVGHSFLSKWDESLQMKGVSLTSIFVYMRTFQRLINMAKENGLVKKDFAPFKEFSFSKYRRHKTKKRAIPKDDIKAIAAFEIEPHTSMYHSRNYFIFSYYNRGINFIDMALLKWKDINQGRLNYVRRKNKKNFTMALLDPAQEILSYYKEYYYNGQESFVFPILNPDYLSPVSVKNRCKKVLTQVNADLKEIAKELKLSESRLTTYVARHTYATVMKKSGQSTAVISEALGHDSESTTQIYLDSFENDVLDEASKAIL